MDKPPIKYTLQIPEGYEMFLNEVNNGKKVIGMYFNIFFYIQKNEDGNFVVEKNIYPYGNVTEISSDVFDAIKKIVNKYNL
jgi:hypothetical protein